MHAPSRDDSILSIGWLPTIYRSRTSAALPGGASTGAQSGRPSPILFADFCLCGVAILGQSSLVWHGLGRRDRPKMRAAIWKGWLKTTACQTDDDPDRDNDPSRSD
jgi:hypothetical protein